MFMIQLDSEIGKRLERAVEITGLTSDFHVREAILGYLEDIEDAHLVAGRIASPDPVFSAEEVKAELGFQ